MSFAHAIVVRAPFLSLRLAVLGLAVACAAPSNQPASSGETSVRPGANEVFLADDLDVDRFVGIFEGESREVFVNRGHIVKALELSPGATVADIGTGTGLFLPAFDQAVGRDGRVYAVDISPRFLEHVRARIAGEGLERVRVVRAREDSVELPPQSVDVVFVCDTYHHFEYPRSTLASLHAAIRPGGVLWIVDFERIPGESSDWMLDHVRAGKEVFTREIENAGFHFVGEVSVEGLDENYVLRFRRP